MSDPPAHDPADDDVERDALGRLARRLAEAPPLADPPVELRARTLAAALRDDAPAGPVSLPAERERERRHHALASRVRRHRRPLAGALAAAAAVLLLLLAGGREGGAPAKLELRAELRGEGGKASVEVRRAGIGRTVAFTSDSLPILPKGDFYEVWFVGPGDSPRRPNRISAGTFHPDPQGRSRLRLVAAVDPKLKRRIEVTAEPGDGDPRPSREVVLRTPAR